MSRPINPEANVLLAPLTTWKIGGPAQWFVAPEGEEEVVEAVNWAREKGLPVYILGRGSNLLIADEGLKGLVICMRKLGRKGSTLPNPGLSETDPPVLSAPAGLSLPRFSKQIASLGYTGYEFYIGIPGTVGGAVVMNAGFGPGDERQTAKRCLEVKVLDGKGTIGWRRYNDFNPVYRHTDLVDGEHVVLAARFALKRPARPEEIRRETAQHLAMRKNKQPLTRPTAGSVFKGTGAGIPAAVYIDRCGLKGHRIGDAVVSNKHANWIENVGAARAVEVLALMDHVKAVVREREGVDLEAEVRFLH